MVVQCILVVLFCVGQSLVRANEPIAIIPPLELRTRGVAPSYMSAGNPVHPIAYPASQQSQYQILHTRNQNVPIRARDSGDIARTPQQRDPVNSSLSVEDLFRALGMDESDGTDANENLRAAEQYPNSNPEGPYPPGYGSQSQPYPSPGYLNPGYPAPVPPVPEDYRPSSKTISLLKPLALNFVKPFATKVSSKIGGFLSIILALLGAGGDSTGLLGLKDILVNGIIKPLFLVKGGLKALIGKLAIPLISLLLINLEVLITIWWLWEDCGAVHVVAPVPAPVPVYSQPLPVQYPNPVLYNNVQPPSSYNQY